MSIPIASEEPKQIHAGETVKWTKSLSDYPANDGWQLNYKIQGGASAVDLAFATDVLASGADFAATASSAKTASLNAGATKLKRWLYGYVTKSGEIAKVYFADLLVLPRLDQSSANYDGRTHAQKVLDAIESTLEGIASREEKIIRVNSGGIDKELQFCSVDELHKLRVAYKHERADELVAENIAAGKGSGRRILTRYPR